MGWETELFALFDDLEGQATALWEADREAELADRARSEYVAVTLASRLMASLDSTVVLDVVALGRVEGRLQRVAASWCLVTAAGQDWILPLRHVVAVRGASERSVPEVAWSPLQKLGLRSALRRLSDAEARCVVHLADGSSHEVHVTRVGADFVQCRTGSDERMLVPYDGLVAVQSRGDRVGQVASTS